MKYYGCDFKTPEGNSRGAPALSDGQGLSRVGVVVPGPYREGLTSIGVRSLDSREGTTFSRSCTSRAAGRSTAWSSHEAPVSAQRSETCKKAWLPQPHEYPRRPSRSPVASPEGPRPPVGMIERLSSRRTFDELRAHGVRTGRGPVRRLSRPNLTQSARFGYAIPRSVGSAVVRNRIKRRVRAVLTELDNEFGLPGGDHLIRVTAPITDWSHAKLRRTMADLMQLSAGMASADPRKGQR